MLEIVISGAQTGADRAGLDAAKTAGFKTGGWMPKGFIAQDGNWPEFATKYGISEHSSQAYPPRTAQNVKESDGTIRFATHWQSPGEKLTLKMINKYGRPFIDAGPRKDTRPHDVIEWIKRNNIRVLNVAGNSERTSSGIYQYTIDFLLEVFSGIINQETKNGIN